MAINKLMASQKLSATEQVRKYSKYWYYFAIAIVLCLAAAHLFILTTVPQYKVSSTLLIQDDAKGDGVMKGTAFSDLDMFKASKTVDNEMEILRSRDLLYKVLTDLDLQTNYSYKLALRSKELYGKDLPVKVVVSELKKPAYLHQLAVTPLNDKEFKLVDGEKQFTYQYNQPIKQADYSITVVKGPAFKASEKEIHIGFVDLNKAAEYYSKAGMVVMPTIKDANTISISMLDAVPQRGIDILTRLIQQYNMENVTNKNLMATNTIKFIDGKLQQMSKELSGVEQDVENYKRSNRVTELSSDAQMNLQNSDAYGSQLSTANVQLDLVQSIITYLASSNDSFEMVPTTLGLKDPILMGLTEKYNNLQIERQRLLRTNSESNPLVMNITEQLAGLKSNLLENLRVIRKGLQLEKNSLNRKTSQFEGRLKAVPTIERGLLEKSREQGVKTGLYQYLLQKREETELSLSATIPTSQVIDKPAYSSTPAKPKTQMIYMIGFLAGCFIPVASIYSISFFGNKVKDLNDVGELTSEVRVLGELSNKGNGDTIVVHKNQSTTISELFKYIRSNLNFMEARKGSKVFLVTSSIQGEGKTFFSVNLGITLSLANKKVVMLEFDLRKPDLLNAMSVQKGLGLSEYLSSESVTVDDILVHSGNDDDLWMIGCGKPPKNPSEILLNPKVEVLFHELRKRFDYIIVDTPPVGQISDAFTLAPHADASIYVVRYNFTTKGELSVFEEICENQRLKNPMLVFNDANKDNKNVYRYGRYAS